MNMPASAPSAVLDTNVLLDWLVFANPVVRPLVAAIGAKRLRWLATDAMRDEMDHVLERRRDSLRPEDGAAWRAAWARHANVLAAPASSVATLHCSDRSDQKFIDLAVSARADWLLTRDRALLKLARRARDFGVEVLTPERWALHSVD